MTVPETSATTHRRAKITDYVQCEKKTRLMSATDIKP